MYSSWYMSRQIHCQCLDDPFSPNHQSTWFPRSKLLAWTITKSRPHCDDTPTLSLNTCRDPYSHNNLSSLYKNYHEVIILEEVLRFYTLHSLQYVIINEDLNREGNSINRVLYFITRYFFSIWFGSLWDTHSPFLDYKVFNCIQNNLSGPFWSSKPTRCHWSTWQPMKSEGFLRLCSDKDFRGDLWRDWTNEGKVKQTLPFSFPSTNPWSKHSLKIPFLQHVYPPKKP